MEWTDLDDALSEGVVPDEVPAEVAPASDLAEVNRLMRRLRSARRKSEQIRATANVERGRITAWEAEESGKLGVVIDYIERALEGWVRNEYRVAKTKTSVLPYGTLRLRPKQPSVVVTDEEAAVAWLVDHQRLDVLDFKVSVRKAEMKKAAVVGDVVRTDAADGVVARDVSLPTPSTGEVGLVPGVELHESFTLGFTIQLRDDQGEPDA